MGVNGQRVCGRHTTPVTLVRYYGWYSNVSRGKRRKAQGENPAPIGEFIEISDLISRFTGSAEICR